MAPDPARSTEQRRLDTLAKLAQRDVDVWVATGSADGSPHLIPLSLCWDGDRVILATETRSLTYRNLVRSRRGRLALGPERDVVMIDAVLVSTIAVEEAPKPVAEAYATQTDWDPRQAGPGFVYIILAPERIMAWREANEIAGRTLMRRGQWIE